MTEIALVEKQCSHALRLTIGREAGSDEATITVKGQLHGTQQGRLSRERRDDMSQAGQKLMELITEKLAARGFTVTEPPRPDVVRKAPKKITYAATINVAGKADGELQEPFETAAQEAETALSLMRFAKTSDKEEERRAGLQ